MWLLFRRKPTSCWRAFPTHRAGSRTSDRPRSDHPGRRLRIGYFSADFHEHPTAQLLAGVIESHDRTQVEVYGFEFGSPVHDTMRARMVAAFDHTIEAGERSDGNSSP